ncbi:unnamed protein product, partial [Tetraodon nigroviridis]
MAPHGLPKVFLVFYVPESPLLLPSLRLFIPPLRLVSAAMWQVIQRGHVQDYGMVEEFISTVSEIVPELLNADQKAELLLGLRARVSPGDSASPCKSANKAVCFPKFPRKLLTQLRTLQNRPSSKTLNDISRPFQALSGCFRLKRNFLLQVVLELCRAEPMADAETIEAHLERIRALVSTWAAQPCFAQVEFPESNFVDQVESLMKDPEEKERFFQVVFPALLFFPLSNSPVMEIHGNKTGALHRCPLQDVFPTDFGPEYDGALQMLMLDFLSRLEKLLPVPDIQQVPKPSRETRRRLEAPGTATALTVPCPPAPQTATLLDAVPSALDECVHSVPDPRHLKTVLHYHAMLGHFDLLGCGGSCDESQSIPSSFGNCILSSLSLPQLEKVEIDAEQLELQPAAEQIRGCMTVQVEGQTVTLLDYIQIEQPSGLMAPDEEPERNRPEAVGRGGGRRRRAKAGGVPAAEAEQTAAAEEDAVGRGERRGCQEAAQEVPQREDLPRVQQDFPAEGPMRRHLETHSANRELKYKCASCDKRFRDHYDMKRHVMRVHEKDEVGNGAGEEEAADPGTSDALERKNCPLCGKYFARHVDMERHKRFKNPYVLKRHQKEICKSRELKKPKKREPPQRPAPQPPADGSAESKVCPICSRTLPYSADVAKHLRSHSEERPYICVTCEKGFKYRDTLKKHQIIHGHEGVREEQSKTVEQILAEADAQGCGQAAPGESRPQPPAESPAQVGKVLRKAPKVCPVCARTFDSVKTLNRHVQCHTEDRPFHCIHCKKRFKHMHGLKRHQIYAICHKKAARFSWKREPRPGGEAAAGDAQQALKIPTWCSNCGKHFEYPAALKEHQEKVCTAELSEIMSCGDCGKEFKSMTLLKVHQRIHDPLYCKECGKILASEPAFERHKLMHRPMQCTMCDKTFTLLRRLREHYEKQHGFTGPYPCAQCSKTFMQLSYLAIHQRIFQQRAPLRVPPVPREVPLLQLPERPPLHAHGREALPLLAVRQVLPLGLGAHRAHGDPLGGEAVGCGQCEAAYRTKLQLTNHVEQVHIGVRYPCNICGKQFMKETSLKRHELIHTGERPHQCTVCGKTFLTANELKLHNRYHTGERPYKCEECGKAFIQSGYLKSHMRIHTGEKPFKCDFCDKGFRLSYHMKKHRRTHAGNAKTYSCKECGTAFLVKKLLWEHALTHG